MSTPCNFLKFDRDAKRAVFVMMCLGILGGFGWSASAQPLFPSRPFLQEASKKGSRSVWDGVYTDDQAKRGAVIAERECGACHGATLTDGDEGPALAGESFLAEWDGQDVGGLFERMSKTMPQTAPGKLSGQEYVDILAQILKLNKFPAGKTELESSPESLKQIRIEATKPKN
jgi:S-disulfanyl-L-cysteine oxidoreductase SoxD